MKTIAAIATGLTPSGIGIVRISGPESYEVIRRIFVPASEMQKKSSSTDTETAVSRDTATASTIDTAAAESSCCVVGESSRCGIGESNCSTTCNGSCNAATTSCNATTTSCNVVAASTGVDVWKPNRIHYGYIVSRETLIDEVLVMNMKAPHSYTGEDTIEINCHGGPLMMRRILQTVLECGADVRLAEPGEFTKRAFLNGRIDLSQAESVIDIINASNENSQKAALSQLRGSVSEAVKSLRDRLLRQSAFIEAALDDPEHYVLDEESRESLRDETDSVLREITDLMKTYRYGKIMKEGINTCILGKPNAGKSSLLNALLGEDRAIVTEVPGTTRDIITESIVAGNLTLNIMDTAGIRDTGDLVESIGVKKAYEMAKKADLCLYVIDSTAEMDEKDREILNFIRDNGLKAVYVINKADIGDADLAAKAATASAGAEATTSASQAAKAACDEGNRNAAAASASAAAKAAADAVTVAVSAKTGAGIRNLLDRICGLFDDGVLSMNDQVVITSERHLGHLKDACDALRRVLTSIEQDMPEDFYTIDLMDAYHSLGLIIGEETEDDLCDRIFSEFCMGK